MPVSDHPVWVDDEYFNLLYPLRHASLPLPGDIRQLKRLVGRILSQKLDRARPLWELWFIEGLDDGRFAVLSKVHHSVYPNSTTSQGIPRCAAISPTGFRSSPTRRWSRRERRPRRSRPRKPQRWRSRTPRASDCAHWVMPATEELPMSGRSMMPQ